MDSQEQIGEAAEPLVSELASMPDGFDWEKADTWPDEFRQLFEWAAKVAYTGLVETDKRMLDVQITGTSEPVTMLFAIGERAEELRRAWRSVFAINNATAPREPALNTASSAGSEEVA